MTVHDEHATNVHVWPIFGIVCIQCDNTIRLDSAAPAAFDCCVQCMLEIATCSPACFTKQCCPSCALDPSTRRFESPGLPSAELPCSRCGYRYGRHFRDRSDVKCLDDDCVQGWYGVQRKESGNEQAKDHQPGHSFPEWSP